MGVRALMLSCEVCLGGSAGDRAVLGLLTQKRQAMGVERGWRRAWTLQSTWQSPPSEEEELAAGHRGNVGTKEEVALERFS